MLPRRLEEWMPYAEVTLIAAALFVAGIAFALSRLAGE
jgi:hypothetical protein